MVKNLRKYIFVFTMPVFDMVNKASIKLVLLR